MTSSPFLSSLRKLAFEFLVIAMGVLAAFAVQTWSESRGEKAKLRRYLEAISEELTANAAKVDRVVANTQVQADTTDMITSLLAGHRRPDKAKLREFYVYTSLSFKLGSYDALKSSSVLDELQSIELIRQLNNLVAQVESSLEFQKQVDDIYFETMIFRNNNAVDLVYYEVTSDVVYSIEYINKLKYLSSMRQVLAREFARIRTDIDKVQLLIESELADI